MAIFKDVMIGPVDVKFGQTAAPSKWNNMKNVSEEALETTPGAKYSVTVEPTKEQWSEFFSECKAHHINCEADDPTLGAFEVVHGAKKQDDGTVTITASRNAMNAKGTLNRKIPIVDRQKREVEDRRVMGGAKINLQVSIFTAKNPSSGKSGISVGLSAIQVLDAGNGGGGALMFDAVPEAPSQAANTTDPLTDAFDDAIPF